LDVIMRGEKSPRSKNRVKAEITTNFIYSEAKVDAETLVQSP
jgi:hypothetical protein